MHKFIGSLIVVFCLSSKAFAWGFTCNNQFGGTYTFDGNTMIAHYSGALSEFIPHGDAWGLFNIITPYQSFHFEVTALQHGLNFAYTCFSGDHGTTYSCNPERFHEAILLYNCHLQ
jgi:hypothetical protein